MLWFSPVKALPLVSWFAPAELRDIPEWKVGLCLLLALLEGLRNDPRPPPHTAGLLRARLEGASPGQTLACGTAEPFSQSLTSQRPRGSCSSQGLSTLRACPPGSMVGGEPCMDPGRQKGCFGGRGAGPHLACPHLHGEPPSGPCPGVRRNPGHDSGQGHWRATQTLCSHGYPERSSTSSPARRPQSWRAPLGAHLGGGT